MSRRNSSCSAEDFLNSGRVRDTTCLFSVARPKFAEHQPRESAQEKNIFYRIVSICLSEKCRQATKNKKALPLIREDVSLILHRKEGEPFDDPSRTFEDEDLGCSFRLLSGRLAHDRELEGRGSSGRPGGFGTRGVDQPVALTAYCFPSTTCRACQTQPSLSEQLDHRGRGCCSTCAPAAPRFASWIRCRALDRTAWGRPQRLSRLSEPSAGNLAHKRGRRNASGALPRHFAADSGGYHGGRGPVQEGGRP